MSDYAIQVHGLGKCYRIYHTRQGLQPHAGPRSLRNDLASKARKVLNRLQGKGDLQSEQFWALKDVSFDLREGEVLGVIGHNGAGKSTLLKILSRITAPTEGHVRLAGRVASLLEVGTGFHPEFTGRENIFLNGTILGMTHREIRRQFDEIVAFAEIEQFLDTPVKRYSSGMYVRLAFSVAAHLQPEIMIVDEVLSVGDVAFQRKCLGKMDDIATAGRAVIFVSHNLAAVQSLCSRAILLERGKVVIDSDTSAVLNRYIASSERSNSRDLSDLSLHDGPGEFGRFVSISLFDSSGQPRDTFRMGETMTIRLEIKCHRLLREPEIAIKLTNALGISLHLFLSNWEGLDEPLPEGKRIYEVQFPVHAFPGTYVLHIWMKRQAANIDDRVRSAIVFNVEQADITGHQPYFTRYAWGSEVYLPSSWRFE
jgi:lipopolysaccharide transport system ATP-binding protein